MSDQKWNTKWGVKGENDVKLGEKQNKYVTFRSYLHYGSTRGWDLGYNRARCWRWESLLNNNSSLRAGQKHIWDLEGGRTDYSGDRLQRNLLKTPHESHAASTAHTHLHFWVCPSLLLTELVAFTPHTWFIYELRDHNLLILCFYRSQSSQSACLLL